MPLFYLCDVVLEGRGLISARLQMHQKTQPVACLVYTQLIKPEPLLF
jgi:hypothetical protein